MSYTNIVSKIGDDRYDHMQTSKPDSVVINKNQKLNLQIGNKSIIPQGTVHKDHNCCGTSCNNSFGILEHIEDRIDNCIKNGKRCTEDGRSGKISNLPKLLQNDFILEH